MRLLVWLGLLLPLSAVAETAQVLIYAEKEPGVEPFLSRYVITPDYLRADDGDSSGDYLVYDRRNRVIYSVAHGERAIAEVHMRPMKAEPPMPLALREKNPAMSADAPSVGGRRPEQHVLYAGDRLCVDVIAVPGLMPEAVKALAEMQQVLAGEHAAMIPHVPADVQDACDLSVNVFAAGWPLRFGLPIQQRDYAERVRSLMDFRVEEIDSGLFDLPEGYRRYSVSDLK